MNGLLSESMTQGVLERLDVRESERDRRDALACALDRS